MRLRRGGRAVDTAHHLCAASGWGPPADNGYALRLLGEHGVLPPGLAARRSRAVGFRNILVHDHARVNDDVLRVFVIRPGRP